MAGTAYREFNKLWTGRTLSQLGDRLYALGMVWWVVERTGTPAWTGLLLLCDAVPGLIVTLIAGPWIDRWRTQRILVATDLLRAGALMLLGSAVVTSIATPVMVAATAAVLACLTAMHDPASQSILPDVVAAEKLSGANARIQTTEGFCTILGPVLGGLCTVGFGFGAAVWINAATFILSAAFAGWLRLPRQTAAQKVAVQDGCELKAAAQDAAEPKAAMQAVAGEPAKATLARERYTTSLVAGFRFVLMRRDIRRLLLVVVAAHFFTGGFSCLLPGLASQLPGAGSGADRLAWLQSLLGCGLLMGGVLHRLLPEPRSPLRRIAWVLPVAGAFLTAASLVLGNLSGSRSDHSGARVLPDLPLASLACCLYGVMLSLAAIQWMTALQRETPRAMSGRVFGLCTFAGNASMPLAYVVFGSLQAFLPAAPLLGLIGIGLLVVRLCLRAGRDLNASPATGYDGI